MFGFKTFRGCNQLYSKMKLVDHITLNIECYVKAGVVNFFPTCPQEESDRVLQFPLVKGRDPVPGLVAKSEPFRCTSYTQVQILPENLLKLFALEFRERCHARD